MSDGYGRVPRFVTDKLPEIGAYAYAVYGVLADYCDHARFCKPSLTTLCQRTGISRPTVVHALRLLEEHGCIRRLRQAGQRLSFELPMISVGKAPLLVSSDGKAPLPVNDVYRLTTFTDPVKHVYRSGKAPLPPSEQEPLNKNQEQEPDSVRIATVRRRDTTADMERFERWWAEYPRKSAKRKALDWWLRRKPDDQLTDTMIAAVRTQRTTPSWTKDGGQYIPLPTTWLNGERWQDQDVDRSMFTGNNGAGASRHKQAEQDQRTAIWDAIKDTFPEDTPCPWEGGPPDGL